MIIDLSKINTSLEEDIIKEDFLCNYNGIYEKALTLLNDIGEKWKGILDLYNNSAIQALNEQIDAINRSVQPMLKYLEALKPNKELQHLLQQQAEQAETIRKLELLGSFGWTIIPNKDPYGYNAPDNQKEADEYMFSLITDDEESELFDIIKNQTDRCDDVNEAIAVYKQGYFKSCALILFALTDSLFMRFYYNGENYRTAGTRSLDLFFEDIGQMPASFQFFRYCSLKNSMPLIFVNKTNFQADENVINRHSLCHGMFKRAVTRKDCLQLFLLYYNLLSYIQAYDKYIENHRSVS